ncbi:MAG: hypothetical protein ABI241_00510 [Bacteroidia bacterium]
MEIEALKKKHGKIYTLTVSLDEDDATKVATIYLKKADRTTRAIVDKLVERDKAAAIEAALKNLYVGGDDLNLILLNDDALFSCESAIVDIMKVQAAILKKN